MSVQRTGLFDSLRQLFGTALELGQVRLELLIGDLELEKMRLVDVALRALLGVMLLGLGLVLLIGLVLMLLWDGYRLPALAVLTLLCIAGGLWLMHAARQHLRGGEQMLAATSAELARDRAALGPSGDAV